MSGKLLLDTNAILGFLKGHPSIIALLQAAETGSLCASVITRMELLSFHGMTSEEEKRIHDLLDAISIIPLNAEVEDTAVRLRRATRRKMPDAIVAASAIASKAVLVTYDQELAGTIFPGLITRHPDNPA
ncbi:MAG: PIN domain-containing protein [Phycisphaerae bacterium]|nr:PIN domain-containing protein [Phycisphaerae bacterium]